MDARGMLPTCQHGFGPWHGCIRMTQVAQLSLKGPHCSVVPIPLWFYAVSIPLLLVLHVMKRRANAAACAVAGGASAGAGDA